MYPLAQAQIVDGGDPSPIILDYAIQVGALFVLIFAIALGFAIISFAWRRARDLVTIDQSDMDEANRRYEESLRR